jgi:hypothetical protein
LGRAVIRGVRVGEGMVEGGSGLGVSRPHGKYENGRYENAVEICSLGNIAAACRLPKRGEAVSESTNSNIT